MQRSLGCQFVASLFAQVCVGFLGFSRHCARYPGGTRSGFGWQVRQLGFIGRVHARQGPRFGQRLHEGVTHVLCFVSVINLMPANATADPGLGHTFALRIDTPSALKAK